MTPEFDKSEYWEEQLVTPIERGDGIIIGVETATFRGVPDGVFVEIRDGSSYTSVYYSVSDTVLLGEGSLKIGAKILAYTYALEYEESKDLLVKGKLLQAEIEELKIRNRSSR